MSERLRPLPIDPSELELEEDLTPTIEAILAGTYKPLVSEEEMAEVQENSKRKHEIKGWDEPNPPGVEKARALWKKIKAERNAHVAIYNSEVWNHPGFAAERQDIVAADVPLHEKLELAKKSYMHAIARWFSAQELKGAEAPLAPQIARFERLTRFRDYVFETDNPARHIQRGIGTAVQVADGLIKTIETEAAKQDIDLSHGRLEKIAARAFRNIGMVLANTNIEVGPEIIRQAFDTPDLFRLTREADDYVLTMDPEVLAWTANLKGESIFGKRYGKTTRCPAMYRINGHAAVIPEYFKWVLEIIKSSDTE